MRQHRAAEASAAGRRLPWFNSAARTRLAHLNTRENAMKWLSQAESTIVGVTVVCFSHDERQVWLNVNGEKRWHPVEYIVIEGERTARGFAKVFGQLHCVFA